MLTKHYWVMQLLAKSKTKCQKDEKDSMMNQTVLEMMKPPFLQKSKSSLCTVVFDGYNGKSKKDHDHRRLGEHLQPSDDIVVDREEFLSNIGNKEQFISLLTEDL